MSPMPIYRVGKPCVEGDDDKTHVSPKEEATERLTCFRNFEKRHTSKYDDIRRNTESGEEL